MLSLVGAFLVGAASLTAGLEKSKREKERLLILRGLVSFCRYVGEEIRAYRTPLWKIYEGFENAALKEAGFIKTLRELGLASAVEELCGLVDADVLSELSHFANALGGGDREGQEALCELTLSRLERAEERALAAADQKMRMYKLLPLLLGASVIILLL